MAADADTPVEASQSVEAAKLATGGGYPSASPSESRYEDSQPASAAKAETKEVSAHEADDYEAVADEVDDSENAVAAARSSHVRLATVFGVIVVIAVGALAGWFGSQAHKLHQAQHQRQLLIQTGRQGALNIATIDWQHADSDVQRILDSATGTFYDDMSKRRQPFIDVIKKVQSKTVGTVTEAGLESQSGDDAQVLVAVSVNTSNLGAREQAPRAWRMRISLHTTGNDTKVSNVEFMP
ncbi:Mce protein [uncultured Mycobacterium sp.]|uniref:Mce protein n=1 Tax=uncultured Mycobacterium sp. TaxID=171292 RepID=UPI0035CBF0F4